MRTSTINRKTAETLSTGGIDVQSNLLSRLRLLKQHQLLQQDIHACGVHLLCEKQLALHEKRVADGVNHCSVGCFLNNVLFFLIKSLRFLQSK